MQAPCLFSGHFSEPYASGRVAFEHLNQLRQVIDAHRVHGLPALNEKLAFFIDSNGRSDDFVAARKVHQVDLASGGAFDEELPRLRQPGTARRRHCTVYRPPGNAHFDLEVAVQGRFVNHLPATAVQRPRQFWLTVSCNSASPGTPRYLLV